LINAGTITGGTGPSGFNGVAVQFGTRAASLIVNPGAIFNGQVVANATVPDVLVLAGTTAGTLTGLGTSFVNFSSISVSPSANWTFSSANTLGAGAALSIGAAGKLTNSGSLSITGSTRVSGAGSFINSAAVSVGSGKMEFLAPVSGTGTVSIQSGATADFEKSVAATQKTSFPALASLQTELEFGNPSTFLGTIANFGTMDKIDLLNTPATSRSFSGGKLTVQNGSTTVASLSFAGSYSTGNFVLGPDGQGGSLITWHS
jgi:hypothetical protein